MTNLNPRKPGSGPQAGIPNHVRGSMQEMGELFEAGSVDFLMSSMLPFSEVNWEVAARPRRR